MELPGSGGGGWSEPVASRPMFWKWRLSRTDQIDQKCERKKERKKERRKERKEGRKKEKKERKKITRLKK